MSTKPFHMLGPIWLCRTHTQEASLEQLFVQFATSSLSSCPGLSQKIQTGPDSVGVTLENYRKDHRRLVGRSTGSCIILFRGRTESFMLGQDSLRPLSNLIRVLLCCHLVISHLISKQDFLQVLRTAYLDTYGLPQSSYVPDDANPLPFL